LVEAVTETVSDIFLNQRHADKAVAKLLKSNKKWGARDRAFIAGAVYDIVRWRRLILHCAGEDLALSRQNMWKLFGVWWIIRPYRLGNGEPAELPQWEEFNGIPEVTVLLKRLEEARKVRRINESVPDWLDQLGSTELGESWSTELRALNKEAPLVLRVNTLKTSVQAVREIFGENETTLVSGVPDAVILQKRQNVTVRDSFKMGYFEVQDAASQHVVPFLGVAPGQVVVDACAGAGGKTLHLAAMMENKGRLVALDVEFRKLEELNVRAKRNGVSNLTTTWIDSDQVIDGLTNTADRLLLDVPCSGLGVLRRNPDTKWKLTATFLDAVRKVQWNILTTYCQIVKKGGRMVYATCSVLPSESEDQVQRFLGQRGAEWRLIEERRMSPANDGFDGFYMALLERM
jgi:16S rRNA (cytosine967-C5)-methyltransferase